MTTLFVLDVEDFRPLAEVAGKDPDVTVRRRGPYLEVAAPGSIRIDRNAAGRRNAVWFSSVAAVEDGRVARWDREELVIEPDGPEE
ncbi:LSm family protein [Amycolatopsis jiangsuensis]|uniref:Uncharacterized protein n=1 Tax=Amycolatopsis jiangsuensis TaxID=1181879 RepID=A0A840IQK8_9PSEU|nr:hypothetical protein [Amycolatopsis jiangsuensis]MBB4683829.1 hypothetical protein [Amycolatopsis jiangsuensis]